MSFASALRHMRAQSGLSQSRLAARAGYDHSYISRLESGNRMPTREAVVSLANAMGCTAAQMDRLLDAANYKRVDGTYLADCDPAVIMLQSALRMMPAHTASELSASIRGLLRTYM